MRWAALLVIGTVVFGCGGPTSTASPTSAATPRGSPSLEPSSGLGTFNCRLPVRLPAAATEQTHLTDIRIAGHAGSDRIVWEFDRGLPEVDLRQATPPFTTDPAGQPLPVEGEAFLQIVFHGASRGGADGAITYDGPTDFDPYLPELWQVRMAGDFEATMTFILGLVAAPCFDLFTLETPSRVVLDLAGQ